MREFQIGIIGVGTVAATHVKAVAALPSVHIRAVCDIKGRNEISVPEGAAYYQDYQEMLGAEKLDAVHICLPHYLHMPVMKAVAEHGIPVLCEKPVGMNFREVQEMASYSEKYGVPIAVCMQNRWNNTFQALKTAISGGEHGRLIGLKAVALWSRDAAYYQRAPWRGDMRFAGGGCLINQAVHTLDQIIQIGGDIASVEGIVTNVLDYDIDVEDSSVSNVVFRNGARALIIASNAHVVNSTIEIEAVTEKSIFTIKDFKLYRAPASEPLDKTLVAEDELMPGSKSYYGAGHVHLIRDFYSYLSGNDVPFVTVEDAGRVIGLIDLIRKSSREGRRTEWEELYGEC